MANVFKKIWDFLWHSNSPWSFIVDIVLIFLIVKFLLLPGIGLILGSPVPLVIVESGSMEHYAAKYCVQFDVNGKCVKMSQDYKICDKYFGKSSFFNFDEYWDECGYWYEPKNITKEQFSKFSSKNGFDKGDIMMIKGQKSYNVGDVIVFKIPGHSTPIIHRIISVKNDGTPIYSTKGDHNDGQISYEGSISKEQILGREIFRIPKIGWVKLFFVELFQ